MKTELIAHEDPKSHVSELFRTLRTNVQFMNSNKKMQTLLVTSTVPGEGKTWISSNLAITFAQAGKKVILIDADMRKCGLHNIFKMPSSPGLSNYLAGINQNEKETKKVEDFLRKTEVPNLYLIPAGNVPPNPSELLTTSQMTTLLETLKGRCDLVIIDGTPSKLVTDAIILSRFVDSTIIVVGHNMARKEDLAKVVRDIKNVGGNVAGIVYNQKPVSNKKKNETYYYASARTRSDAKKKQLEYEQKRQSQRNRVTDMLDRDKDSNDKLPEQRTAEMLKQFNEYLQKEKKNRDNRS